jgi:hypothetical protein
MTELRFYAFDLESLALLRVRTGAYFAIEVPAELDFPAGIAAAPMRIMGRARLAAPRAHVHVTLDSIWITARILLVANVASVRATGQISLFEKGVFTAFGARVTGAGAVRATARGHLQSHTARCLVDVVQAAVPGEWIIVLDDTEDDDVMMITSH